MNSGGAGSKTFGASRRWHPTEPDLHLKLSLDRKVSPRATPQLSKLRWIPTVPNSFGLASGDSCPGRTPFCRSCYAEAGERSKGVRELVEHNLRLLQQDGTEDGMTSLLTEMIGRYVAEADRIRLSARDRIFRIHWDGDFFSIDYATAWARTVQRFEDVAFWAYTRSFVVPCNVVPHLAGIGNLALYLSADPWNIEAARQVVAEFPDVHLAACALDYNTARDLVGARKSVICPENAEKMPLTSTRGRGACADCRLCVVGRTDVLFSTSHQEQVLLRPTIRSRANA